MGTDGGVNGVVQHGGASSSDSASSPTSNGGMASIRRSSAGGSESGAMYLSPGRLIALATFVGLALLTYAHVRSGDLERFVLVVKDDPYGTLHLFMLFHILSVVFLFPVMILQVLSGALYGLYMGTFITWVGSSVGQALAFLLGRYLFRRSVKALLAQRVPQFPLIDAAVKKEGWKLMCLLRLSPILPYNVLNYAAALTPISFVSYALSSSVAIVPWMCLYTYLGTLSTSVVDLARGKVQYRSHASSGMQLLSSALYMVLLSITIVYGYVLSKRAIATLLKTAAEQEEASQAAMQLELQREV